MTPVVMHARISEIRAELLEVIGTLVPTGRPQPVGTPALPATQEDDLMLDDLILAANRLGRVASHLHFGGPAA